LPEEIKGVKDSFFPGYLGPQVLEIFLEETDLKAGYRLLGNDQEQHVFAYS
jgi:hypothetical protein